MLTSVTILSTTSNKTSNTNNLFLGFIRNKTVFGIFFYVEELKYLINLTVLTAERHSLPGWRSPRERGEVDVCLQEMVLLLAPSAPVAVILVIFLTRLDAD